MKHRLIIKVVIFCSILAVILTLALISDIVINGSNPHTNLHLFLGGIQMLSLGVIIVLNHKAIKIINKEYENIEYSNKRLEKLKAMLINSTPTGVVMIKSSGIIEFVNPAAGEILGSTKTIGLNILDFDTVKQSIIYNGILAARNGQPTEILAEPYTSYTTRIKKTLNFYIVPFSDEGTHIVTDIILFIHDVTKEHEMKAEIENTYMSTIEALAQLVDARDTYTGKHSKNVSTYVSMMLSGLEMDEKSKAEIILAAKIHDIGKVGISDSILNKPGKLTIEEYTLIKQHPTIGADILKQITGFSDISLVIRHHHERWDGKGYPACLKETDIPLGSQIIAIADTYDAITTDRVYRTNLGKDKAIQILLQEKGHQFNPELIDIFLKKLV